MLLCECWCLRCRCRCRCRVAAAAKHNIRCYFHHRFARRRIHHLPAAAAAKRTRPPKSTRNFIHTHPIYTEYHRIHKLANPRVQYAFNFILYKRIYCRARIYIHTSSRLVHTDIHSNVHRTDSALACVHARVVYYMI